MMIKNFIMLFECISIFSMKIDSQMLIFSGYSNPFKKIQMFN